MIAVGPMLGHLSFGVEGPRVELLDAVGGLDHLLGLLCVGFVTRSGQGHPAMLPGVFGILAILGAVTLSASGVVAGVGAVTLGLLGILLVLQRPRWGAVVAVAVFGASYGAEQAGAPGRGDGISLGPELAATVAITLAVLAVGYLVGVEADERERLTAAGAVLGSLTLLAVLAGTVPLCGQC